MCFVLFQGSIPIDGEFEVQIKNDTSFTIYVPAKKRSYILEDLERDSSSVDWKDKILTATKKK